MFVKINVPSSWWGRYARLGFGVKRCEGFWINSKLGSGILAYSNPNLLMLYAKTQTDNILYWKSLTSHPVSFHQFRSHQPLSFLGVMDKPKANTKPIKSFLARFSALIIDITLKKQFSSTHPLRRTLNMGRYTVLLGANKFKCTGVPNPTPNSLTSIALQCVCRALSSRVRV